MKQSTNHFKNKVEIIFRPNWASPPGDSIADAIQERGLSWSDLALRLGCSEEKFAQLIDGQLPLTLEMANSLERELGCSAAFWLQREAIYLKRKARLEAVK